MAEGTPPLPEELHRRVGRLKLRVLRAVRTHLSGAYASAFRGAGLEFAEFRRYEPGDDVRRIDWKVTARRGAPYVRRYVEERELRVVLALDVSRSMGSGASERSRRWRASLAAAAFALSAASSGDRVGGVLFADRILAIVPPRRGQKHALALLRRGLQQAPAGPTTDLRPALRALRNLRAHAVVVLLSDFITRPPPWDAEVQGPLSACAARHDCLAVRLWDGEGALPAENTLLSVRDAESGRHAFLDARAGSRTRIDAATARHRQLTRDALARCGVAAAELAPEEDLLAKLNQLLATRRR
ncbi:MAG: DUF58 domain-containing protein [Planctomycetota bacterium]